jgi:superfamily I DNA and/or RNA helicase
MAIYNNVELVRLQRLLIDKNKELVKILKDRSRSVQERIILNNEILALHEAINELKDG